MLSCPHGHFDRPAGVRRERVALIVVDYQGDGLLWRCLDGVAAQTCRPDRTILVDNGGVWDAVTLQRRYPGIEVIRPGSNIGFAAANNLAIERSADCRWVALLNPDAIAAPGWLEALLAAARAHPRTAAFGSRMYTGPQRGVLDGTGDVLHLSGLVWRRDHGCPARGRRTESGPILSPCAAAALYDRSVLVEAGGFDEDFFCYLEDVDLGLRLYLAGKTSRYVSDAEVVHLGSVQSGGRDSDFALYHGHRNLVWLLLKDLPLPLLVLLAPLQLAMQLAILAVYALRGRGPVIWRAKRDALAGLRGVWRRRARVQSTRRIPIHRLLSAMSLGVRCRRSDDSSRHLSA